MIISRANEKKYIFKQLTSNVILLFSIFRFASTSLSFLTMVHYVCCMRAQTEQVQKQEMDHLSHHFIAIKRDRP